MQVPMPAPSYGRRAERGLPSLEADAPIDAGEPRTLRLVRPPRRTRHPSPIVLAYWTVYSRLASRRSPSAASAPSSAPGSR